MIRKFEFPTKELADQFIFAHKSEDERKSFIGPMQIAIAWTNENEDHIPLVITDWMVDTDNVDALPEWVQYEVTPTNPLHTIAGREEEYKNNLV